MKTIIKQGPFLTNKAQISSGRTLDKVAGYFHKILNVYIFLNIVEKTIHLFRYQNLNISCIRMLKSSVSVISV